MNPTYHPEARGLAFNVKCPLLRDMRGTAGQRSRAYDRAQELWWEDAKQLAIAHGFDDVCQVGRSGGWLAPVTAGACIHPEEDHEFDRLNTFGDALAEMMGEANERFTAELDAVMTEEAREQAELARIETHDALLDAVREYVRAGHDVSIYRTIEAALAAYDEARA